MPQFEVQANELTDVKVSHVSLVKHGAIRLPFRILKSEGDETMFNLKTLYKSAASQPTIAAIVVNKSGNLAVAKARIEKAGLQIENFDESQDGVIVFPQVDELGDIKPGENGAYIVKMDEQLSVILTGIEKSFESINFDSTSFDEVMAQEGMRPGVHLSMEILGATVSNIFAKVEDRAEMVTELSKTLDQFKDHILGMAEAVPENAFSVDFFKASDFADVGQTDAEREAAAAAEVVAAAAAITAAGTSEAEAAAAAAAIAAVGAQTTQTGDEGSAGNTELSAGMAQVVGQMSALAKTLTALTEAAKTTATTVTKQGTQIADAVALAKAANDATAKLTNTVAGDAGGDPTPAAASTLVKKSGDIGYEPPLIDTAYNKPPRLLEAG